MKLCLVTAALLFASVIHDIVACDLDSLREWAKARIKTLGGCSKLAAGGDADNYQKAPKAKLFLYTHDEWEVISDFLQYYSYIFGAHNIVVIDDDSRMEPVCKALALFQECGTIVVTDKGDMGSFAKKEISLNKEMKKYHDTFLIPLDTDEFILSYAQDEPQVVVNRTELWKAFANLAIDGRKYKLADYHMAYPPSNVCTDTNQTIRDYRRLASNNLFRSTSPAGPRTKTFFHSDGFIVTDGGNHYGEVKHDHGHTNTHPLVAANFNFYFNMLYAPMVHYRVGSYLGTKDKYMRVAVSVGFDGSSNCSASRVNNQYCSFVKEYMNGTDHGKGMYTQACHRPAYQKYTLVAEWFQKNTLSMHQLTDDTLPMDQLTSYSPLSVTKLTKSSTPSVQKLPDAIIQQPTTQKKSSFWSASPWANKWSWNPFQS